MKLKNNIKLYFLLVWVVCLNTNKLIGQKHYVTPKHSIGLELSYSLALLQNYSSNYSQIYYSFPTYSFGNGSSLILPYQYSSKKSFLGFQSGLGLFMWSVNRSSGFTTENYDFYTIGLPIVVQFKVSKSFWIESGFQINFPVYNSLFAHNQPISVSDVEIQAVLGFRYHLFKSFSFRGRIHHGISPAYQFSHEAMPIFGAPSANYRYRLIAFEMGVSYLFPLKK